MLGRRKEERLSPFCFPPSHHSFALSWDTRAIQIEKTGDESVVALYLKPVQTPGRNIVGQQLPTLLEVVASVCM